jgi:hypothetical protein
MATPALEKENTSWGRDRRARNKRRARIQPRLRNSAKDNSTAML